MITYMYLDTFFCEVESNIRFFIYNEIRISSTHHHHHFSPERNIIEAASNGASNSIKLVANIVVCLIAFLAILDFVDKTLFWMGTRVGLIPPDYPPLSFEVRNRSNFMI